MPNVIRCERASSGQPCTCRACLGADSTETGPGADTTSSQAVIDPNPSGENAPAAATSFFTLADYLVNGYWVATGRSARSWQSNTISVNIVGLTQSEQALAIAAMNQWREFANLNFFTTTGAANITFNHNGSFVAVTNSSVAGDYLSSAVIDISSNWAQDNYMYQTYLHELGHALGLGHQGNYNFNATYSTQAIWANDTWAMSIMSYFSQSNYNNGSPIYLATPMLSDIWAIQTIYGAQTSTRTGNTIYGYGSNASSIYDFSLNGGRAFTIYDTGGSDLLNGSQSLANQAIILLQGNQSSMAGFTDNVSVAVGAVIESAYGGSGNDTIMGNSSANGLWGFAGNDLIYGFENDDYIDGGAGNDSIYGGDGHDRLYGGVGNDLIVGEADNDLLFGGSGSDNMNGGSVDDTMFGEDGDDAVVGGDGNDFLAGQNGNDYLYGNAGTDFLLIGAGTDVTFGGAGADTFYLEGPNLGTDIITDFSFGEGDRFVLSAAGFGVPAGFQIQQGLGFFWGANAAPRAQTATVYFNTLTNVLWFDIDATGAGAPRALAFLTNTPGLAATSFSFG